MAKADSSIDFEITGVIDDDYWGSIKVIIDGKLLLKLRNYPLSELSRQLKEWADIVDDSQKTLCFIFYSESPEYLGTFRIEARPKNWEFTSWKEKRRPPRLLELAAYKAIAYKYVSKLSNAAINVNRNNA